MLLPLALWLWAGALSGQEVRLTLSEAKAAAADLLNAGDAFGAYQIASVVAENNPADTEALILVASAARTLNRHDIAHAAARQAYNSTENRNLKYAAARLAAFSLADQKSYSWAQFWLRLARQYAPNAREANGIARDYQEIRRLNPWSFTASAGVAPSGNINGGSQGDTAFVEDTVSEGILAFLAGLGFFDPETGLRQLGDNERALSGIEASLSLGAQYRLNQTQSSATFLSANGSVFRYRLNEESQEASPTSENSDFDRESLSFGLRHVRVFGEGWRPTTFSIGFGKNWYGGEPNNRYVTAGISQPFLLSHRELLTLGMTATASAAYRDDIPVRNFGVSARLLAIQDNGDRVTSQVRLNKSNSDIEDSDFASLSLGVNYGFARPIYGFGVALNADATYSDIGDTRFAPFDRTDRKMTISADITIPQAEVFGFQPVVSFGYEQNESTVDQFDSSAGTFELNFRSSF